MKLEDFVIIGLIVGGFAVGIVLELYSVVRPVIIATMIALAASGAVYRFLGGTEGSTFVVGALKLTGTAAVFAGLLWFVNDLLERQERIEPDPASFIVVDKATAAPTAVKIHGVERIPVPSGPVFQDKPWDADLNQRGLSLYSRDDSTFIIGYVERASLKALHLSNHIDPGSFRYTGKLKARASERLLLPRKDGSVASFTIRGTQYRDDVNNYQLASDFSDVTYSGGLRNKEVGIIHYEGGHYLLLVVEADHRTPGSEWARFGFGELVVDLD